MTPVASGLRTTENLLIAMDGSSPSNACWYSPFRSRTIARRVPTCESVAAAAPRMSWATVQDLPLPVFPSTATCRPKSLLPLTMTEASPASGAVPRRRASGSEQSRDHDLCLGRLGKADRVPHRRESEQAAVKAANYLPVLPSCRPDYPKRHGPEYAFRRRQTDMIGATAEGHEIVRNPDPGHHRQDRTCFCWEDHEAVEAGVVDPCLIEGGAMGRLPVDLNGYV